MKKRILSILVCMCMLTGMFAGCGKKEDGGQPDDGKDGGKEQIELTILSTLVTENGKKDRGPKQFRRAAGCIFYAHRIYGAGIRYGNYCRS